MHRIIRAILYASLYQVGLDVGRCPPMGISLGSCLSGIICNFICRGAVARVRRTGVFPWLLLPPALFVANYVIGNPWFGGRTGAEGAVCKKGMRPIGYWHGVCLFALILACVLSVGGRRIHRAGEKSG